MPDAEWTEARIAELRALREGGARFDAIAARMGISPNAVAGKVHRLNIKSLVPRVPGRRSRVRAGQTTIAPPPSIAAPPKEQPHSKAPAKEQLQSKALPVAAPAAAPPKILVPVALKPPPDRACCWPEGDPGSPSFRFCSAPAEKLKPYCAEHQRRAWITVRRRA
jgi:GcrA cell cycle regulator